MALMHHQFESIHPFYDGNGRTGRILNVLYLVKEGLLDVPVLYLSSLASKHDIAAGIEAGADDYLTKPISAEVLLSKLHAAIRTRRHLLHAAL